MEKKYTITVKYDSGKLTSDHPGANEDSLNKAIRAFQDRDVLVVKKESCGFMIDFSKVSYMGYDMERK